MIASPANSLDFSSRWRSFAEHRRVRPSHDAVPATLESLFYLHRGALKRNLIDDLWKRKAATSAPVLAQVLLSEPILDAARKAIRPASEYNPDTDEPARILRSEVIRPDLLLR